MSAIENTLDLNKLVRTTPASMNSQISNSILEVRNRPSPSLGASKCNSELLQYQCLKWDEVFDFQKILNQLQNAEKELQNASIELNSDGKLLHQVKRLNGGDMPYFGIAPKQDPTVVVVCEVCNSTSKIVGLNNHMMLQHPTVWSSVPNRTVSLSSHTDSPMHINDNSVESVMDLNASCISDVSSGVTSSLSASTSCLSLTHISNSRNKTPGSVRSRSKSKHNSSPSISNEGVFGLIKSSKKHSTTSLTNIGSSMIAAPKVTGIHSVFETDHPLVGYSSSSNSSCSMPSVTKTSSSHTVDIVPISFDTTSRGVADSKEKLSIDGLFSKKKTKSPSFTGQESVDSSTSSSSSEYERAGSHGTVPPKLLSPKTNKIPAAIARTINRGNAHHFEKHISELDRAVSSITGGQGEKLDPSSQSVVENADPKLSVFYKRKKASIKLEKSHNTMPSPSAKTQSFINATNSHSTLSASRPREDKISHQLSSTNDKLSIDALERKLTHEHRHGKDNRSHSHIEKSHSATVNRHFIAPPIKRMRIDESQQHKSSKKTVTYSDQQAQYMRDDPSGVGILEEMPVTNEETIVKGEEVYHIKTIDALQFQQLMYQQQNHAYNSIIEETNVHQMLGENSEKLDAEKPPNYENVFPPVAYTYDANTCNILAANFQVFDIPSLTDNEEQPIVSNTLSKVEELPQYVLPANEDHIVYEISPSNEVTFVESPQPQKNKAEFSVSQKFEDNITPVEEIAADVSYTENDSLWENVFDTQAIELENFDLAKTLGDRNSSRHQVKTVRKERSLANFKSHEDLNANILTYPGIPRPLAMNTFGLVKYPQSMAATFRKTVLNTRKANNCPTTLTGASVNSSARYANTNSKVSTNYFTALPGAGTGSVNEYSIGNITISSAPTISQQPTTSFTLQRQHSLSGGIELLFSPSTSASTANQASTSHRARQKSGASLAPFSTSSFSGPSKHMPMTVVTPMIQSSSFTMLPAPPLVKTTIANTATNVDRSNLTKRSLIANTTPSHGYNTSSNQLSDMFSLGKWLRQQTGCEVGNSDVRGINESDNFGDSEILHERRQNLLNMTDNGSHQNAHINRKLLLQQQLQRTYSDCSFDNLSQYKNNANQTTDIFV